MRRFTPDEIRRFLQALDSHLPAEVTITIIRGSAAALAYSVTSGTVDVDTFESDLTAFEAELSAARTETGIALVVQPAENADMPWSYQDRLLFELHELRRLHVFVSERHAAVRGSDSTAESHLELRCQCAATTIVGAGDRSVARAHARPSTA